MALKAFGAANPTPVRPASYPDNATLRDGIVDGTYTIAYKDALSDGWYYLTASFLEQKTDDPPYWDFLWDPITVSGSYKFTERAVVLSSGTPHLGAAAMEFGPGDYASGDELNLGWWVKTL